MWVRSLSAFRLPSFLTKLSLKQFLFPQPRRRFDGIWSLRDPTCHWLPGCVAHPLSKQATAAAIYLCPRPWTPGQTFADSEAAVRWWTKTRRSFKVHSIRADEELSSRPISPIPAFGLFTDESCERRTKGADILASFLLNTQLECPPNDCPSRRFVWVPGQRYGLKAWSISIGLKPWIRCSSMLERYEYETL